MKAVWKGVLICVVHIGLVGSLAGKLLYDRATLPRAWALTAPIDPTLPIRGRYVRLSLVVDAPGIPAPKATDRLARLEPTRVTLQVADGRLQAVAKPASEHERSDFNLRFINLRGETLPILSQPLAFFIPESVPDPSIRPDGEQLWVEVTVPERGPPRPIRLGVRKNDGPIVPLALN